MSLDGEDYGEDYEASLPEPRKTFYQAHVFPKHIIDGLKVQNVQNVKNRKNERLRMDNLRSHAYKRKGFLFLEKVSLGFGFGSDFSP